MAATAQPICPVREKRPPVTDFGNGAEAAVGDYALVASVVCLLRVRIVE